MPSVNETIGIGVFGYGFMASAHLEALQRIPGTRAVAVCGPRLERAQELAARHGAPLATSDPQALLSHPDVDAVLVDTPDATHYPLVMAAAGRGKHVYCEKPLAPDIAQAREMAAAVGAAGVRSMMGFSTRFSPLMQEVKRLLDLDTIGRPFHVHAQAFNAGLLATPPRWSWRTDKARSGTGILGDLGSHLIDLNHFFLGPTVQVMASLKTFIPELVDPATGERHRQEVDDDSVLLLRFANGAHGSLALSRLGSVHMDYPIGRRQYVIDGSKGGILWENGVATLHPYKGETVRIAGEPPLWDVDHHTFITGWAQQSLTPFVEAIRSGRDQAPTIRDGLLAQEVIEAAVRSAQTGCWEPVQQVQG
ncbi:MAG TPA: Gfo/Idh/MocA family oxidoreductase [Chloroflexota bacterium]|nr:Gfo/Idh/MocA family oxidoreductase [Chloroflexota bacterium]